MSTLYLLDANVLIAAKNFYYGFDLVPGFWAWLEAEQKRGAIGATAAVLNELAQGSDVLAQWAAERAGTAWCVAEDDAATLHSFAAITAWVLADSRWTAARKADFLGGADPLLIAKAKTSGATVVTLENNDPTTKKKVLIPVVCVAMGVEWCDTFAMMRRLGAGIGARSGGAGGLDD